jgi:hypothetical protein
LPTRFAPRATTCAAQPPYKKKEKMKKTLLATAVLGSMTLNAHAQSSVTLYGVIDAGISYVNNSKTATGHDNLFKYDDGVASRQPLGPARHGRPGWRPEGAVRVGKRL